MPSDTDESSRSQRPSGSGLGKEEISGTPPAVQVPSGSLSECSSPIADLTSVSTKPVGSDLFLQDYDSEEEEEVEATTEPTVSTKEGQDRYRNENWRSRLRPRRSVASTSVVRLWFERRHLPSIATVRSLHSSILNDSRQRSEKRRWNSYQAFCKRANIDTFPISFDTVGKYLSESDHPMPCAVVETLESIRLAVKHHWEGREGVARSPLAEHPAIKEFLQLSSTTADISDKDDGPSSEKETGSRRNLIFNDDIGSEAESERSLSRSTSSQALKVKKAVSTSVSSAGPRTVSPHKRSAAPQTSFSRDSADSEDDQHISPNPSPKKRTRADSASHDVQTDIPAAGTAPSTNVSSSSSSSGTSGSITRPSTMQVSQQRPQSLQQPPTPTPTPSPPVPGPRLPRLTTPLPPSQYPAARGTDGTLSPIQLHRLLSSLHTLLDDPDLARVLHRLGVTSTSSLTHLICLDQKETVYKDFIEEMEERGIVKLKCAVLGSKLRGLRASLSD
ncbi:hypothetical protein RQP46_011125 [Phenoliferia psychrophenolica]